MLADVIRRAPAGQASAATRLLDREQCHRSAVVIEFSLQQAVISFGIA